MTGVLAIDKPEGPSSHDMVAAARRGLGIRRVGHTGTLDPFATGLLLLCIGPATRLAEYLADLPKRYEATARLGVRTDTLDLTGHVTAEHPLPPDLSPEQVREAFEGQVGRRLQVPPAFSAKKLGGRRAYELARRGETVEPAAVEVEVMALRVLGLEGPDVRFDVTCSSGTYIRAIARDAGDALSVGAHLTALRRTRIGRFSVTEALSPDRLGDPEAVARALVPPLDALAHLPLVPLDEVAAAAVRHGQAIPAPGAPIGTVALALHGTLLAMAESDGQRIRPRKVLA
jgi:tRNA pseudouridine55 synthase